MNNVIVVVLLGAFILIPFTICNGQKVQPLEVGEKAPDFLFSEVAGSTKKPIKLSKLKGRLIVLDFWSKSCSACIAGFPRLEELKKKFGIEIDVLLVTPDSLEDYLKLKEHSAILNGISLPVILNGDIFKKYFPNPTLPYQVWLDSSLTVIALTDGQNTNIKNVASYLQSGSVPAVIQRNYYKDYDATASILTEGNGRNLGLVSSYSVFFDDLPHVGKYKSVLIYDSKERKIAGVKILRGSLSRLCQLVFRDFGDKMEFQPRPGSSLSAKSIDSLFADAKFCYEMKMPKEDWGSYPKFEKTVLEDIKRYFNIDTAHEIRTVYLHKIRRTGNSTVLQSNPVPNRHFMEKFEGKLFLKNVSVDVLAANLKWIVAPTFRNNNVKFNFEDETGYGPDLRTDFTLAINPTTSIKEINKQLLKYGLKIVVEKVEEKFLILKQG